MPISRAGMAKGQESHCGQVRSRTWAGLGVVAMTGVVAGGRRAHTVIPTFAEAAMTDPEHEVHEHEHEHGEGCGHEVVEHGDHIDYLHDGHRHALHGDHYDEH